MVARTGCHCRYRHMKAWRDIWTRTGRCLSVEQGSKANGAYEGAKMLGIVCCSVIRLKLAGVVDPIRGWRKAFPCRLINERCVIAYVIQAMHLYSSITACPRREVAQVVDHIGISRTNLETPFIDEIGCIDARAIAPVTQSFIARRELSHLDQSPVWRNRPEPAAYPPCNTCSTVARKNVGMTALRRIASCPSRSLVRP